MKWGEFKQVPIADIVLPDDDGLNHLDNERADAIAASASHTAGPVNLPVVEVSTMECVSGKHRVRGELRRGMDTVLVRMWSGSPEEKRIVRAADNAHPRSDGDAWRAELVAARAAKIEADRANGQFPNNSFGNTPGRKKSAKGEAREQVAKELGTTTDALRMAERRAAEKANPPEPPPPGPYDAEFYEKPKPIEQEVGAFVREVEEMLEPLAATMAKLQGSELQLLGDRVLEARRALETALGEVVAHILRGRANIRRASKPSSPTDPGARVGRKPRCHCAAHLPGHEEGCPWREPEAAPLVTNLGDVLKVEAEGPRVGLGGARLRGEPPPQNRPEKCLDILLVDQDGNEMKYDPFAEDPDEAF